jgi:hypothetical protein
MQEFLPVLLAAALGIVISLYTRGALRWVLNCVAVALSGLAATTFTGEFEESSLYLLQDLAEAAVGLALGVALARWVLPRLGVTRAIRDARSKRAHAEHALAQAGEH